jgi:hypothetical protein
MGQCFFPCYVSFPVFWSHFTDLFVARGLRILLYFAGFCRGKLLILIRIRVALATHNP